MALNVAIVSPSENAYSETFIQAHKKYLSGNIFFYYGGIPPENLEGKGTINPWFFKGVNFVIGKFKNILNYDENEALKRSFKKENIQVVLAEYGNMANTILPVCKKLKIPLIAHFHGADASVRKTIKQNNNYKDLFQYATYVVGVSKKMCETLIELGCPTSKVIHTPCAPDNSFCQLNPTLEQELFIGIGRFVNKKAPYYTILAFKEVVNEFPNAQLVIAGDGYLWDVCFNLIRIYNLEKNIKLLGVIEPETYKSYLLKARAFVQHSITANNGDMEGTPVGVTEASSAGVPVISTYHAGISDVIIHNKTGLLVQEHDIIGMANNMKKLLNDKELAIVLGQNGKKFINENYSMEKHIDILNKIIQKSISN